MEHCKAVEMNGKSTYTDTERSSRYIKYKKVKFRGKNSCSIMPFLKRQKYQYLHLYICKYIESSGKIHIKPRTVSSNKGICIMWLGISTRLFMSSLYASVLIFHMQTSKLILKSYHNKNLYISTFLSYKKQMGDRICACQHCLVKENVLLVIIWNHKMLSGNFQS